MEIDRYILEKDIVDGVERVHLMRIVFIDGVGFRGEAYYGGRWQPYPGALSYMHDPSPGEFIDEEEAMEVIRQKDQGR